MMFEKCTMMDLTLGLKSVRLRFGFEINDALYQSLQILWYFFILKILSKNYFYSFIEIENFTATRYNITR